jgi:hypothetical protein
MLPGGYMDIIKALKREEAKLEKNVKSALKHLNIIRATMNFFGGSAKPKLAGRKRRKMSAAARARMAKGQQARWVKVRELKAAAAKAPKSTMSAAGRARIAKAQKARWAKLRAAKTKKAA